MDSGAKERIVHFERVVEVERCIEEKLRCSVKCSSHAAVIKGCGLEKLEVLQPPLLIGTVSGLTSSI